MKGTTYSTLSVAEDEDFEEVSSTSTTLRRVFHVSAIFAAVVVMFFAGRVYEGEVTPFTHEEVMDVASKCEEGSYIGGCTNCRECATYEFNNGGCNFFKDTFCSFCEPIGHCTREEVECTNRYDQQCNKCDTGFWDGDCKACTVCRPEDGVWEYSPCEQGADAVCKPCSELEDGQFVNEACSKTADTEFTGCKHCPSGKFTDEPCGPGISYTAGSFGSAGDQTECKVCSECGPGQWVSGLCTENSDTQCSECEGCDEMEPDVTEYGSFYTATACKPGSWQDYGANTECGECTYTEETGGVFETSPCGGLNDAQFQDCTNCRIGQYERDACKRLEDSVCPECSPIPHCDATMTICSTVDDSECRDSNSNDDTAIALGFCNTGEVQGETTVGWFGTNCEYMKIPARCGVDSYRERQARKGKFTSTDINEWVAWCMDLCNVFDDCLAFEVDDKGVGPAESGIFENGQVNGQSVCRLKNTPITTISDDYSGDCYVNVVRVAGDLGNDEAAILEQLNA